MNKLKNKDYFEQIYFIILIVALLIRSINFYSLLPQRLDSIVFAFLALAGFLVVIYELFLLFRKKNFEWQDWIIIIFLISLLISAIVNMEFGLVSNIKLLVWNSIYMVGIYQFSKRQKGALGFVNYINYVLMVGMFLISLASLIMYFFQYNYVYVYGSGPRDHIRIGFLESRLFGMFGDPNYGATTAVITIILCLFYLVKLNKETNYIIKFFLISNVVIQYCILILTGSRSALLLSYLAVGFITFAVVLYRQKIKGKLGIKKIIYTCFVTLLILFGYLVVQNGTKDILVKLPNQIHSIVSKTENIDRPETENKKTKITLERKDVVNNSDISNMRFSIWRSSIEIFKSSPIFGSSPRNLLDYAHKNLPQTFIAEKSIVIHNAYFNVLASLGLAGFIPFMLFIIINGLQLLIYYFKHQIKMPAYFLAFLSIEIIIVMSGMFNNEIVLVNTIGSFLFWCYLGFLNGGVKEANQLEQ